MFRRTAITLMSCFLCGLVWADTQLESYPQSKRWQQTMMQVVTQHSELSTRFFHSIHLHTNRAHAEKLHEAFFSASDVHDAISGYDVIHIDGDFFGEIVVNDQSEIVISGDVAEGAKIYTSGIPRIFIGGSLIGEIHSKGGNQIYIGENLLGKILFSPPYTHVHVNGDLVGAIQPMANTHGGLGLRVNGFTSMQQVKDISTLDVVHILAVFNLSDHPQGIYGSALNSAFAVNQQVAAK